MNTLYGIFFLCSLCSLTSMCHAQSNPSFSLKDYQWKNRVLLVFAEEESTEAYENIVKSIDTNQEAFDDRDMVLISLFEKGKSYAGETPLESESVRQLQQDFDVQPGDFRAYLIGKDGGIKQQGGEEIRIENLFALIDTMPMRRNEVRRRSNKP